MNLRSCIPRFCMMALVAGVLLLAPACRDAQGGGCGGNGGGQTQPTPQEQPQQPAAEEPAAKEPAAKEPAVTYTCPMHPDVTQSAPGKCPQCGMDLVKKDQ